MSVELKRSTNQISLKCQKGKFQSQCWDLVDKIELTFQPSLSYRRTTRIKVSPSSNKIPEEFFLFPKILKKNLAFLHSAAKFKRLNFIAFRMEFLWGPKASFKCMYYTILPLRLITLCHCQSLHRKKLNFIGRSKNIFYYLELAN